MIALLVVLALAGSATAEGDPTEDVREAVVDAINAERQRRGLRRLKEDGKLRDAAADRLRDMFARRLATGQRSAAQAVARWMRSRGHRETLLGAFDDVGVAVAPGSPTRRATSGYTFVALFARER